MICWHNNYQHSYCQTTLLLHNRLNRLATNHNIYSLWQQHKLELSHYFATPSSQSPIPLTHVFSHLNTRYPTLPNIIYNAARYCHFNTATTNITTTNVPLPTSAHLIAQHIRTHIIDSMCVNNSSFAEVGSHALLYQKAVYRAGLFTLASKNNNNYLMYLQHDSPHIRITRARLRFNRVSLNTQLYLYHSSPSPCLSFFCNYCGPPYLDNRIHLLLSCQQFHRQRCLLTYQLSLLNLSLSMQLILGCVEQLQHSHQRTKVLEYTSKFLQHIMSIRKNI